MPSNWINKGINHAGRECGLGLSTRTNIADVENIGMGEDSNGNMIGRGLSKAILQNQRTNIFKSLSESNELDSKV